ncbi:MAG TPA: hypothetical protein VL334_15660 [Anaerolineae bacterium]|nr:hypothetical protein [Anaerolineae bacterium]
MSESALIWFEVIFNVAYLIAIWGIVMAMTLHRDRVAPQDRRVAALGRWAFLLLALGDTGHVGFRVWAYAAGGLENTVTVLGREVGLVGLGALATAVTVTFFYVLMLMMWQARYGKPYGWFGALLFVMAGLRLLLMIPAANQWNSVTPPQPWSIIRNLPLMVLGLGVAYLFLRDALRIHDRPFVWVGSLIVVSYAMYIPVILFVQQAPLVGMLMIPKTLAYVAIAVVLWRSLYGRELNMAVAPT